jgi:hypothetical protein
MPDANLGWDALKWAWTNRAEILDRLGKVRSWFRADPGRGILVIGPGGVGKSTLAALLSGDFDWLTSEPWRYDESYGIEGRSLKDDPKTKIVIPPGQTARREATWGDVERQLASGAYRGVILVTANGFHTLPTESYKSHALYAGNKEEFLTAYLRACRTDEAGVVDRVMTAARPAPGKLWVLSVVTKEDLWWPGRQQVADEFTAGAYAAAIGQLKAARGQQRFRHECLPMSLVINNLSTAENELLSRNAEGYDHKRQVSSVRKLFEMLNALREWEGS